MILPLKERQPLSTRPGPYSPNQSDLTDLNGDAYHGAFDQMGE